MIYIKPPEWTPPPEPEPESEKEGEGGGELSNIIGTPGQHISASSSPLYVPPPTSAIGAEGTQPQQTGGNGLLGSILGGGFPTDVVEIIPPSPAELPVKPSLKADSVEMREGSNVILDNLASAPKLDPSELSAVSQQSPAVQVKPYAFYEPSPIPKTVENRASAADYKENEIRKQLDEALKNKRKP